MRTIPGMVVINPSDDIEARAAVRAAYEYVGPVYMRFGRLAVPVINDRPDYKFELGKGVVLREGKDVTIIATGLPVNNCLQAAEKLAAEGIDAKVINIHTIKPLDEELIMRPHRKQAKSLQSKSIRLSEDLEAQYVMCFPQMFRQKCLRSELTMCMENQVRRLN